MKIIFFCGSMEPGRDGVGDYTRRLAAELSRKGKQVAIIALKDGAVDDTIEEFQEADGRQIQVYRITYKLAENKRFNLAKDYTDRFGPDWVSLQYVPYAFHDKGLPLQFANQFEKISGKRRLHIMFHEIWIGTGPGSRWKSHLISILQKTILKRMANTLKPLAVHTHLPLYLEQLSKIGYKIKDLPLFSNIHTEAYNPENGYGNVFRIGFFSQIENTEPIYEFLDHFGKQLNDKGMQMELLLMGGKKEEMLDFKERLEKRDTFRDKVTYSGFLTPKDLSFALQSCHLGLSPIPRHGLGKSGSVAAFLAHGIPVAAPIGDNDHSDIGFFSPTLQASILVEPDFNKLKSAKIAAQVGKHEINIDAIAEKFLTDLNLTFIFDKTDRTVGQI